MTDTTKTIEVTSKLKRERILKIGYNKSQTDNSKIPAIRISGQYLESLGFHPDGKFKMVINDDGSLTLRPAE